MVRGRDCNFGKRDNSVNGEGKEKEEASCTRIYPSKGVLGIGGEQKGEEA